MERLLREAGENSKSLRPSFRSFNEVMAVASQFFSMLPVAKLSFSRCGNMWRIVFTATGGFQ
jgi:hypothetical protein